MTTLYDSKIPLQLIKIVGQKRTQSRLIRLIEVVFSKGTMLSVTGKSESVNKCTHTDQQKIKFYNLGVQWKCR